jgi:purine catabolism regulator
MHGITLQEALDILPQNSIKLLTGEKNLHRIVTGVTLIETPDVRDWVKGGELLLTTGYIYKDSPEQLLDLIKQLHQKKAAALGIKLNRYLDYVPEKILAKARELGFPVFAILTEKPTFLEIISGVYQRLEEHKALQHIEDKLLDKFLREILLEDLTSNKEMVKENALLNKVSLEKPKVVFVLQGDTFNQETINSYKNIFCYVIGSRLVTLYQANKLALIGEVPSQDDATKKVALKMATAVKKNYEMKYPNSNLLVGISRFYPDLFQLPKALVEAEKSLTIGTTVWPGKSLFHYEEMGFYRLIVNQTASEELKAFYQDTLEALVSYDQSNQTCLIATLDEFLKQNGNISLTAQNLFVHYNTVKYRISQIEELLNINLKNAEDRFNLQVALKIRQLLTS